VITSPGLPFTLHPAQPALTVVCCLDTVAMDEEPHPLFSALIRAQLVGSGDHGMVDFIRKRLQVFVSSTYKDLIRQRQAAVEAILTAGHIPAGMELFTSGDESQMEVIKHWIDESDIFLLILGGRYGSLEPRTGKSYIHLEYEYAFDKGKPLFSGVVTDSAQEKRVREFGTGVMETDNPQKLKEFRMLVLSRMVKFWDDFKDIKIAVGETLSQFARRDDLIGWVRPSQEVNMPALADEIARLSKENAELRIQIMQSSHATLPYDPTPTWKDFFDFIQDLAKASQYYYDAVERDDQTSKGAHQGVMREYIDKLKTILDRLDLDATGTSTEGLLPQARQLVYALSEDPKVARQIDDFRLLVARHLRMPDKINHSSRSGTDGEIRA
jgi:hypothetical protein